MVFDRVLPVVMILFAQMNIMLTYVWRSLALCGVVFLSGFSVTVALRHPDLQKRFSDLAAKPVGSFVEALKAMLRKQMEPFRPVIREMKLD